MSDGLSRHFADTPSSVWFGVSILLLELEDFLVLVDFLELDFDELLPLDSDLDAVTVCCT